jgi:hypothetical protein
MPFIFDHEERRDSSKECKYQRYNNWNDYRNGAATQTTYEEGAG